MDRDSFYVIARSTFGELVLWGTNTGQSLQIAPAYGGIFPASDEEQFKELGPDKELQLIFGSTSRSSYDLKGVDGKPVFERALAKLGALDHDPLYGFGIGVGWGSSVATTSETRRGCALGYPVSRQCR
jgi:hypothetical protein